MYIHHYVHIIYTPQRVCIHIIYIPVYVYYMEMRHQASYLCDTDGIQALQLRDFGESFSCLHPWLKRCQNMSNHQDP